MKTEFADLTETKKSVAVEIPSDVVDAQIDRVARWYLQKIAHDLGGIYFYRDLGYDTCGRYALSYLWSQESKTQAIAGDFPELPKLNGTNGNITKARTKLERASCAANQTPSMISTGMRATKNGIATSTRARG